MAYKFNWRKIFHYSVIHVPLTRSLKGFFFSLLKPEFSWRSINCFHGLLTFSERTSVNEGQRLMRLISNENSVFYYFIKMKDYIVETTRSLICELSARVETLFIVYHCVKVFRLFIYLIVWKQGSSGRIAKLSIRNSKKRKISHWQGKTVSCEWRLFSKMNFVTCRSAYHSSCYSIESRTSKNSDRLQTYIEKAYVVVTYSTVCKESPVL